MNPETEILDSRTPSPPYGYSRACTHSREQQIHIVAEFHAHKIRPSRIAYRVGIDIAFIEELIAGETEPEYFAHLLKHYRSKRHQDRLRESSKRSGIARYELQQKIEREYVAETDI
ncbi:MAG: hypothetical protein R3E64_00590 [Halioglobus sp.]